MNRAFLSTILLAISLLFYSCGDDLSGGSAESGNSYTAGVIVDSTGTPIEGIILTLLPEDYNFKLTSMPTVSHFDTTDAEGKFSFAIKTEGLHTLSSYANIGNQQRWGVLVREIELSKTQTAERVDTATVVNSLQIVHAKQGGNYFISGTMWQSGALDTNQTVSFSKLPSGPIPAVYFFYDSDSSSQEVFPDKSVTIQSSGDNIYSDVDQWQYDKEYSLRTEASAADITESFRHFLIPIILDESNFNFSEVKSDGSDIIFTNSKGKKLLHDLSMWNVTQKRAEVWVAVDSIYGGSIEQNISMHWGGATVDNDPEKVYDKKNGYLACWHFSEGNLFTDAGQFKHNGTNTGTVTVDGILGKGREFDEVAGQDYIELPPTTDLFADDELTLVAYIKPNRTPEDWESVFSYFSNDGANESGFSLTYFNGQWRFFVITDGQSDDYFKTIPGTDKVQLNQWNQLVGTYDGSSISLYLNGEHAASITMNGKINWDYPPNYCRIGNYKHDTIEEAFSGTIDEVQILKRAVSAEWVKLNYEWHMK